MITLPAAIDDVFFMLRCRRAIDISSPLYAMMLSPYFTPPPRRAASSLSFAIVFDAMMMLAALLPLYFRCCFEPRHFASASVISPPLLDFRFRCHADCRRFSAMHDIAELIFADSHDACALFILFFFFHFDI